MLTNPRTILKFNYSLYYIVLYSKHGPPTESQEKKDYQDSHTLSLIDNNLWIIQNIPCNKICNDMIIQHSAESFKVGGKVSFPTIEIQNNSGTSQENHQTHLCSLFMGGYTKMSTKNIPRL